MYFRLQCDVTNMSQYWEQINNEHLSLILGCLVSETEDQIQLPFQFKVRYHPGIDGNPKVQPVYDYVASVQTMHKRLVAALQAAGVDNLQIFPAVVTDTVSGHTSEDYVVVNVVGLVSCVDMSKSIGHPIANAHYFERLVIDSNQAHGLLCFRIKQSIIEIIVHQQVADAITKGAFAGVVLEPASESPPSS